MGILSEFNFDDFYKFIISISMISIIISFILAIFKENFFLWILFIVVLVISVGFIYWAGKKWYKNQRFLDRKLEAECQLSEKIASRPVTKEMSVSGEGSKNNQNKTSRIEYKVDSALIGTVQFNLLNDKKVWFWIANLEDKKYLAYVKINLKTKSSSIDLEDEYYGGKKPWRLNAFTGIHAPGMPIPDKIIDEIKNGEPLDITINCEVKDENNNLIDQKLPVTYRYSASSNTWYLEP
jgi:hypothetical protein